MSENGTAPLFNSRDPILVHKPWRMGRKVGRTIYAQIGPEPSDDDPLVGVMDTRLLAADVVCSHNAVLASRPIEPLPTVEDVQGILRRGR